MYSENLVFYEELTKTIKDEFTIRNFGNTSLTHEVSFDENAIGNHFDMGQCKVDTHVI